MAKSFSLNPISNITNKVAFDTFTKKVEKATNSQKSTPDWNAILEICDAVRHKEVTSKYALTTIKKKLYSRSPHQIFFTLLTLESMVKNCGSAIHEEVATVAFCEVLHERLQNTQDQQIRHKILDMLQTWAYAFRDLPQYRPVHDMVTYLKKTGYRFPPLNVSDAMFATHVAPKFVDGDVCYKCNMAFSILNRRHHCRGCGQAFCQTCSTNTSILPRFGIEKPVRVCDNCYKTYGLPSLARGTSNPNNNKKQESLDLFYDDSEKPKTKTSDELQEEEELQLALALSKSEAEHKEKQRRARMQLALSPSTNTTATARPANKKAPAENPEMSHYLNRSYWEKRAETSKASAPSASATNSLPSTSIKDAPQEKKQAKKVHSIDDAEDKEIDKFVETLQTQIEIFVNRMKSDASRGRPIVNDTAVQSLFLNLTAMHTHLIAHIRQLDDKRTYLERLQNKVTEVREYRTALDLLKAEHAAQVATAQEVAEIRRQMELAVKLESLRKSKHSYLQYQRQVAFQRVQEEEKELQGRLDMTKVPYMKPANSGMYSRYQNGPVQSNSQFHFHSPSGKTESNALSNMNSMRIIPQNHLSQTRVQTISINQGKVKQPTLSQSRISTPQNMPQYPSSDVQNVQEQKSLQLNRDHFALNQPSQQQIYQNLPSFNKPLLVQQTNNYTNLMPNNSQPAQDQNVNYFQRNQTDGLQLYAPQYLPQMLQNPSQIPQKYQQPQQVNMQTNRQDQCPNTNPNVQQNYTQNCQYIPPNSQNVLNSIGNTQTAPQNQLKVQSDILNQSQQGYNLNNNLQHQPLPHTMHTAQNTQPQHALPNIQNHQQLNASANLQTHAMTSGQNNVNQNFIPASLTQQPQNLMQSPNSQPQNTVQAIQNNQTQNVLQAPNAQHQNLMTPAQNSQPQNVLQTTNIQGQNIAANSANLPSPSLIQAVQRHQSQTAVPGGQTQNIYKVSQAPQMQNVIQNPQTIQGQGQTIPIQNMVPTAITQLQNASQSAQGPNMVTQTQGLLPNSAAPQTSQPPNASQAQQIASGQNRVQISNNADFQEQAGSEGNSPS